MSNYDILYAIRKRKGEFMMLISPSTRGSYGVMSSGNSIWVIISVVIAIIGGIALYFTFLSKKNEGKFTGFWGWVYDFLTFKKMVIEHILKIVYLIVAIFITLSSFAMISASFLAFLLYLVLGNLIARIAYELFLVVLIICRNTTDINKKMKDQNNNNINE